MKKPSRLFRIISCNFFPIFLLNLILLNPIFAEAKNKQIKLVQSGNLIKIVAIKGAMQIVTSARVLQAGNEGDYIKVKLNNATSPIIVRIVNSGKAVYED